MNPDLIAEFDAAIQALDALGAASVEPRPSIEERLARDIVDLRLHGLDSWQARWIFAPLRSIRLLEGLRLKLMVELDEVRQELRDAEAELSLLRAAGRVADAEFSSRRAVRLLCHEADVRERLDLPVADRIMKARNGIARVLEVSLRHEGREAIRLARESAQPGALPSLAMEAFKRAETYNRIVAEAHRVTGGVDVPVLLADHVTRLRDASAAVERRARAADTPTVAMRAVTPPARAATPASAPNPAPVAARRPTAPQAAVAPAPESPTPPGSTPVPPKTRPSLPRLRGAIVPA